MDYLRRHASAIALIAIIIFTLLFIGIFGGRWFFAGFSAVPQFDTLTLASMWAGLAGA